MMRKIFYFIILLTVNFSNLHGQGYLWSKNFSGTLNNYAQNIANDGSGNVLISGHFSGTVDFDPGAAVFNLTSSGLNDIFICKLTPTGVFLWARKIGSVNQDRSFGIGIDVSDNVLITGDFEGTVDFDPGAAVSNLTSVGGANAYVLKLTNTGNFVWARRISGTGLIVPLSLTTDASSNVIFAGRFTGTADFDPGPGVVNLVSPTTTPFFNAFVSKLNSSGNFVWARKFEGTEYSEIYSVAVDPMGDVYTTGRFTGTVDFDPGASVMNLISTIPIFNTFISKLNSSGNFVFAKRLSNNNGNEGASIDVDNVGNIYVAGSFSTSIDLDPNAGVVNRLSNGNRDAFLCRLTSAGNFSWGHSFGSTNVDEGLSVRVDINGNAYLAGRYTQTVDFNPGAGVNNLTTIGAGGDLFITKFSASGGYVWAASTRTMNSSSFLILSNLSVDPMNNVYVAGEFYGDVDFNPSSSTNAMNSTAYNGFVLKLSNPSPLPIELLFFDARQSDDSIELKWATSAESSNEFFHIERSHDANTWSPIFMIDGAGFSNLPISYTVADAPPYNGVWYYRLSQTDYDGTRTYIGTVAAEFNQNDTGFTVFPNPSSGVLYLNMIHTDLSDFVLYRSDGQMVKGYSVETVSGGYLIDISSLPKGVYFIRSNRYTRIICLV